MRLRSCPPVAFLTSSGLLDTAEYAKKTAYPVITALVSNVPSSPEHCKTVAPRVKIKVIHKNTELESQEPKKWKRKPRAV